MKILFESSRRFEVWRFSVSHRALLLRATRDDRFSTRIDIVFGHVARMQLNATYDGLTIAEAGQAELSMIEGRTGTIVSGETGLYLLGGSLNDYVCSGLPAWHEDEGDYRDPSFFESMLML